MRTYELVVVSKTAQSETARKKMLDGVKAMLKGMDITDQQDWGQKVLSYPIKHEINGYYTFFSFAGNDPIPADLEKRIVNVDGVLRHLVVKTKEVKEKAHAKKAQKAK